MNTFTLEKPIYRAKRKDNREWVYGFYYWYDTICTDNGMDNETGAADYNEYCIDTETLGIDTGYTISRKFTDKEKELLLDALYDEDVAVYVDDIIKSENDNAIGVVRLGEYQNPFNSSEKECHVGIYIEWQGESKEFLRKDFGYWIKRPDISVIGNIYDTPDLISEGKSNE